MYPELKKELDFLKTLPEIHSKPVEPTWERISELTEKIEEEIIKQHELKQEITHWEDFAREYEMLLRRYGIKHHPLTEFKPYYSPKNLDRFPK